MFDNFFQNVGNGLQQGAQALGNVIHNIDSAVMPQQQPQPQSPQMVQQMFKNQPAPAPQLPVQPTQTQANQSAPTNPNSNKVTGAQTVNGIYDQVSQVLGMPATVAQALLEAPRNNSHGTKTNGVLSNTTQSLVQGAMDSANNTVDQNRLSKDGAYEIGTSLQALPFLGPEFEALSTFAPAAADQASFETANAINVAKANVGEAMDNGRLAQGGLQAGYVRVPSYTPPNEAGTVPEQAGGKYVFPGSLPMGRTTAEIKAGAGATPTQGDYVPPAQVPQSEGFPTQSSEPPVQPGTVFSNNGIQREAFPNPNAAETPQEPVSEPSAQQQPWQEFSDQQKSYQTTQDQKIIRQINPSAFVKEDDPVGTVNAIHETLDRYGVTNPSAEEQLAVIPSVRTAIYKTAQAEIAKDPANAPLQTVTDNINREMASQTRLKDISAPAAKDAIDAYNQNLYNEAMNTTNKPVPTEIPYKTLFDMKTLANKDYAKIVQKNLNNQPLTDVEKVNAAYRNGLDKTISARYPNVKQSTMDMSNLYKAQTPLAKAIPKYEAPAMGAGKGGLFKKIAIGGATIPVDLAALHYAGIDPGKILGGMGALGYHLINQGVQNAENWFGNKKVSQSPSANQESGVTQNQNNINNHGYSMTQFDPNVKSPTALPQNGNDIKPLANGTFGVANIYNWADPSDPTGKTPLFTSAQVIQANEKNLANMQGQLAREGGHDTQLQGAITALQGTIAAQKEFSDPVNATYKTVLNANSAYSKAIIDAKSANLDLSNFNGSYNDLIKQIQPQNAVLASDLEALEKMGQVTGNGQIVGGTLTSALQAGAQANLMTLYSTVNEQLGYNGQGNTGIQTAPPQPTQATMPGESSGGAPGFTTTNLPGLGGTNFSNGQPAVAP